MYNEPCDLHNLVFAYSVICIIWCDLHNLVFAYSVDIIVVLIYHIRQFIIYINLWKIVFASLVLSNYYLIGVSSDNVTQEICIRRRRGVPTLIYLHLMFP